MKALRPQHSLLILAILLRGVCAFAADTPQSFTLDGQLFSDAEGKVPLADASIGMNIQILDEDRTCILYEETQSINTVFSKGYFSVQVGSVTTDVKRTGADTANSMSTVFQNLNAVSGRKLSDGTVCSIVPLGGKRRYVRVTISPASMGGGARVLSPDINIDSVPNAIVAERAETLQGLRGTDFLKINTSSGNALSQANLESFFSSNARVTAMTAVVDGTSTNYLRTSGAGAQLPVFTGAPTAPVQGSFWFDTTDQKLKYRTSTTTEILGTGNGSGSVTSVAAAATSGNPISIGGTASVAPTIDIAAASSTANGYLKSSDWTIFNNKQSTALADGSIWIGNGSGVATARAPSGDATMTNAGVVTVGKIQGVAVSSTAPTAGQVLKLVSSVWTPSGFSIGDLKTAAGAQQFAGSTSCTAAQTLTWSSLTDTFTCTDIAIAGSAITSGSISAARLPASASVWTVATNDIYRASGFVGIGTTNPQSPLHIETSATGGATELRMKNTSTTGMSKVVLYNEAETGWAGYQMSNSASTLGSNLAAFTGSHSLNFISDAKLQNGGTNNMSFLTGGWDSATQTRMTISSTGNVGVGLVSPQAKLDVGGVTSTEGSVEGIVPYANTTATYTIPDTSKNIRRLTLTANTTITLPAFTAPADRMFSLTIFLKQDGTGSRTVTFAGNGTDTVKWDSGVAPTISATAGKITVIQLMKAADETVWYGSMVWKEN